MTTVYISAGDQEMVEYAGNTVSGVQTAGQLLRHFVYADGIDEPLEMMTLSTVASPANDTHRYTVPDAGGSVLALLDPTQSGSAALISQYGYRPFGESGDSTGAYRYASRRLDAETGLYYYRARMYSPTLGRFLQPDPIGIKGGFNLYAYVNNDPLNHTDPLGLAADAPVRSSGSGGSRPSGMFAGGGGLLAVGATVACGAAEPCGLIEVGAVVTTVVVGAVLMNQSSKPPGAGSGPTAISPAIPGPDTAGTPPGGPDDLPSAGDLKRASNRDLQKAAQQDGYTRVEEWKTQELQLNSKSDILIDRNGNLYSIPKQGSGSPQPLNVRVPR